MPLSRQGPHVAPANRYAMPRRSKGGRLAAALAGVLFGLMLLVPAAPSIACTRVGSVTVGDCPQPTKTSPKKAPPPTPEQVLFDLLNKERADAGLRALAMDRRAQTMAREHATRMAGRGEIYHNPALATPQGRRELGYPSRLGENVGRGPNARSVHNAFMRSQRHRHNILDTWYRLTGIGIHRRGGTIYVVEIYLTRGGAGGRASSGSDGSYGGAGVPGSSAGRAPAPPGSGAAPPAQGPAEPTEAGPASARYAPWEWFAGGHAPIGAASGAGLGVAAIGLWAPAALHGLAHARRQRTRSKAYDFLPARNTITLSDARSFALSIDPVSSIRRLLT